MLILAVRAALADLVPPVFFEHADHLTDLHSLSAVLVRGGISHILSVRPWEPAGGERRSRVTLKTVCSLPSRSASAFRAMEVR